MERLKEARTTCVEPDGTPAPAASVSAIWQILDENSPRTVRRKAIQERTKQEVQSHYRIGGKNTESHIRTMGAAIGIEDMTKNYTIADQARLLWARAIEQTSAIPGCGRYTLKEALERETIEMRILGEHVKKYRKDFGAKLDHAYDLRASSSTMREDYAQQRLDNHTKMVEYADEAALMTQDAAVMRAALAHIRASIRPLASDVKTVSVDDLKTTDDRRNDCIKAGMLEKELEDVEITRSDLAGKCRHHMHMMMVYTVLKSSMKDQYRCVDNIVNTLVERGEVINQLLRGYESGNNPATLETYQRELEQCGLVRNRIITLDKEYQTRARELSTVHALGDKDLYAAFDRAMQTSVKDCDKEEQDFMRQYRETINKVAPPA